MTLWIHENEYTSALVNDLRRICPDPALAIDIGLRADNSRGSGQVLYVPTMSGVGCDLVALLANSPVWVGLRSEHGEFGLGPGRGKLSDRSGVTVYDGPPLTMVEVMVDYSDCGGRGQFAHDANGDKIAYPLHVSLFHELAHARRLILNTLDASRDDHGGIDDENEYRASVGLPLRDGHTGGCNGPAAGPASTGCVIATAAYGSPFEPEVAQLRSFRDEVLRKTRSGAAFFERYWSYYYTISPRIAALMDEDPAFKEVMRWSVVAPIVGYYDLARRFPDASPEGLPEPWRAFAEATRRDLETWAGAIELPRDLETLPPAQAAEELGTVLQYVLRAPDRRRRYLDELESSGQIPLRADPSQIEAARAILERHGRPAGEIGRILPAAPRSRTRARRTLAGRGDDHVLHRSQIPQTEWIYTVTFTNLSSVVLDEVVLFYARTDLQGIVFLREELLLPGETRVFRLGPCRTLKSYAIGAFIGDDLVAELRDMTPQRASQLNPSDTDPCADSWRLE